MTTVYSGFLDMAFGAAFLLGCVVGLMASWFDSKTNWNPGPPGLMYDPKALEKFRLGGSAAPPPPDAGKLNRG